MRNDTGAGIADAPVTPALSANEVEDLSVNVLSGQHRRGLGASLDAELAPGSYRSSDHRRTLGQTLTFDMRGQGLSDRKQLDRLVPQMSNVYV